MNEVAALTGRAWVFPQDYINTDAMMPRAGYDLPPKQQESLVLSSIRPGWADLVEPGDILVAGRNFGTGSSRPAPTLLRRVGIAGLVCETGTFTNVTTGVSRQGPVLPAMLRQTIAAGGAYAMLRAEGYM